MIIKKPITTEKTVRLLESENTILFEIDKRAKKPEIKKTVEEVFHVKVDKVRVFSRTNKKFAYIKLNKKNLAIDLATKLGMI